MNIELLKKIAEKAVALPRTSFMHGWARKTRKDKEHPCGAVACICATALLLEKPADFRGLVNGELSDWHAHGREILDLSLHQADRLFDRFNWPDSFRIAYGEESERRKHPVKSAKVLKKRILHFIKTNGAE